MWIEDDGQAVEPPTLDEIRKAVRQLKNGKAAGKDGIPAEFLKVESERLFYVLHQVIAMIWEGEEMPSDWLDGIICPIYKKGHRLDCVHGQNPLTANTNAVFEKDIQQRTRCSPCDKFSINFETYDSVKRNELWQIMLEHGFTTKPIRLIRATLDRSKSSVKIAGTISDTFVTLDGLKQDDALSNLLFNIALEGAIRRYGVQRNGTIINKSHMPLEFADDIDINGVDRRAVKEAFVPFKKESARIWLTINSTKTKYMVAGRERGSPNGVVPEGEIDGVLYDVVDEFIYLGTLVTCDDISREVKSTKLALHKSFILHVVLYSHEARSLKETDVRVLGVFERKILRSILGGKEENGEWRRRMNHELYQVYKDADIGRLIKHGRLQ
ncbi:uncharacterized protein LOC131438975 [Malaya genurostris]|uniref:uncharacterized protein LOC131438975 n=1 Tax=Malaya genurostris TaxID=325434 RepID=UPI0026F399E8|nr:uncharacterized protein LOC131438975 [Malaya genurostris]